jgi:hypothetical protein
MPLACGHHALLSFTINPDQRRQVARSPLASTNAAVAGLPSHLTLVTPPLDWSTTFTFVYQLRR